MEINRNEIDMIYKAKSHPLLTCSCDKNDPVVKALLEEVKAVVIPVLDDIEAYRQNDKKTLAYATDLELNFTTFEACKLMQFFRDDWPTQPLTQEQRVELIRKKPPHLYEWDDCDTCRHNVGTLASCLYRSVMLLENAFDNSLDDNPPFRTNYFCSLLVKRTQALYDRAHYIESRMKEVYYGGMLTQLPGIN